MLPLCKSVHPESQGDLSVSVRLTDDIKTPGSWLHPHLCITYCITFPPFLFLSFFCLSPVLFCFFTLPSPWCPLVISTWNFPSCLILQSQSEHLLQDCTSPKFPPVLCPAPSAAVISISSCHVVSSCQSRASLPETHICQRETCGYLCYAATYCGQTDPARPGFFYVLYSSNLQGWAYPSMHWVRGVALRRGHWMQRLEWLK